MHQIGRQIAQMNEYSNQPTSVEAESHHSSVPTSSLQSHHKELDSHHPPSPQSSHDDHHGPDVPDVDRRPSVDRSTPVIPQSPTRSSSDVSM